MDKVNFTAKMDISSIKNNTNRWVNIAKTFEKHTREYPVDTFKVSETQNGIDILNINSKKLLINIIKTCSFVTINLLNKFNLP